MESFFTTNILSIFLPFHFCFETVQINIESLHLTFQRQSVSIFLKMNTNNVETAYESCWKGAIQKTRN